jgi:hypothetical protein
MCGAVTRAVSSARPRLMRNNAATVRQTCYPMSENPDIGHPANWKETGTGRSKNPRVEGKPLWSPTHRDKAAMNGAQSYMRRDRKYGG